jgi:glycosyltransferase involved in cell wall biosynthesis
VRVARVLTRLNLGGPARQALAVDGELAKRGVKVRLFCGVPQAGEGDLFSEFERSGLDVVRVPGLGRGVTGIGDLRALWALRRELASFGPDLLHTHASKAGLLGRLAWPRSKCPRVHTFHGHVLEGYFTPWISERLIRIERSLAAKTDRILAVSHATALDLLRLKVAEREQMVVVPPGVLLDPFLNLDGPHGALRRLIGASDGDFVLGVIGRLAEVKCPGRAVDVFQMLSARHPNLHLAFVGDGSERRSLESRIGSLGPGEADRVHLVGARESMPEVLADLDGVLLSSRTEGMPVALIEAGAAGLPVVAMNVGGVEELVAHERTGFLGTDTDELAYGLDQVLSDPGMGREMGRRARVRMSDKHSASALASRLQAVYETVLEERA